MLVQDASLPSNQAAYFGNERTGGEPGLTTLAALVVLARRKVLILGTTLLFTVAAAVCVSLMQNTFKGEATILPPQQQQSSLASFAAESLGNLAKPGMASQQLGLKNPSDVYIGILKSHTISDAIIAQFHLQDVYRQRFLSETREELLKNATFINGKDTLISIAVQDHDPKRAAAMANAFVEELHKVNSGLAITDASQRRLFFEERLGKERDALSQAEISLKNTQQSTGLVVPAGQAEALIRSASQLRAEIASREVALQATRSYATDQNLQIRVLQSEIATMKAQLSQLASNGMDGPRLDVSAAKLPEVSLEYFRKFRNLRYHETLYELLAKQYEAALIDEAKQAPVIQVIDRATVPDRKSGPARAAVTLATGLLAFVLSSTYVLVVNYIKTLSSDPEKAETFAALRSAARFRR